MQVAAPKLFMTVRNVNTFWRSLVSLPEEKQDGASSWSLSLLQRRLRQQPEFSRISTYTIWQVLHEANWSWQLNRSWCTTAVVKRRCKSGIVEAVER